MADDMTQSKANIPDRLRKIRPVIIALWLSLLFLPFAGIKASVILFIVLGTGTVLMKAIRMALSKSNALDSAASLSCRIGTLPCSRTLRRVVFLFLIPFLFIAPFISSNYFIDVAVLSGIYIILALGLNVVVGFAGLLNLGFVAFYAIGAYSYALLNTMFGLGFWSALPVSVGLTTLSGFLLAIPALRLRGDYLAIVTLGFGEIVRLVLNNWDSVTKGPNGISGIEPPSILNVSLCNLSYYYYFVLVAVMFSVFITNRVYASGIGRAWVAIREDETASSAIGINTTMYKLYAFAFGAFWAGFAGAVFAGKMQFVSPESFTFIESVLILSMVILGGLGSIPGIILGAAILVLLPEVLREVQLYRMLALGCGLVALMIFRPQGLFGGKNVSFRS